MLTQSLYTTLVHYEGLKFRQDKTKIGFPICRIQWFYLFVMSNMAMRRLYGSL